jgi:cytochrome c biogenesis protein CcmG, thiol:disulfide interchange protein DsbE
MPLVLALSLMLVLGAASSGTAQTLDIGQPAPEVALTDLAGNTHRLSEYRGKGVLLNFWATWCVPCRSEMPSMERAFHALSGKGLVVLAVSLDAGSRSAVDDFVKELALTFPILLDSAGESSRTYRVFGLPTSFLIDRNGRIAGREVGARDWNLGESRKKLDALLK